MPAILAAYNSSARESSTISRKRELRAVSNGDLKGNGLHVDCASMLTIQIDSFIMTFSNVGDGMYRLTSHLSNST
jgi:hypothetical protein